MSYKETSYISKPVDANGNVAYTEEENAIWHELYTRQFPLLHNRACNEYIQGLELLNMPKDRIPQCPEISEALQKITGWTLEPVPALIPFDMFFQLLASRRFPAATFIRRREDLNYLQEPDIFHEVFGHCPLLTNPSYAKFTETYGKLGLNASHKDRVMLARLYWFTIEFGLIKKPEGLRAYGGGILSSMSETVYCIESDVPQRHSFNPLEALRTPYKINILQPIYFVINKFEELFQLIEIDLIALIQKARELGENPPLFKIEEN